jgi:hypothetical protein
MLNNPERKYAKYPRGTTEHLRLSRFKRDGPLFTRVNGMIILDDLWIELRSNGNVFRFQNNDRDVINLAYGLKDEFDIGLCSVMLNTRLTLIHDFEMCEECKQFSSLPHSCINDTNLSKFRAKEICFINCDRTQDQLFSQENLELLNKLSIRLFISK